MDLGLRDRVAIVTGASGGLGAAIAEALVAEGVQVLAAARSIGKLEVLASRFGGMIRAQACDMRDQRQVAALPAAALAAFGRLDVIVNNAGIAPAGRFEEQSADLFADVIAVNLLAPATLCRAAAPILLGQRSGKVVNIASTSGITGKPQLVAYSSSKGALLQFTKALAGEWAAANVQVNAIAPGAFETEAQRGVLDDPETLKRRLRKIPAGRMGAPAEIGPLACLLASRASDFITGAVFVIDGGEVSKL